MKGLKVCPSSLHGLPTIPVDRPPEQAELYELPRSKTSQSQSTSPQVDPDAVWAEFTCRQHFFSKLSIAGDGGFTEVPALFTRDRFLWALLSLCLLGMNLYTLLVPNILALTTDSWTVEAESGGARHLVLNGLIKAVIGKRLRSAILMALLELCLLVVLLAYIPRCMFWVWMGRAGTRWHAVRRLLWSRVPALMTFSAMRLLNFVTPSVLVLALSNELTAAKEQRWEKTAPRLLRFLVVRVLCAVVGLEAFMIKFTEAAASIEHSDATGWHALIVSIAFLNQILGIVQINPLLQKRLFVFLFGGEDSFMSSREKIVEQTWCAMVAKSIWEEAQEKGNMAVFWFLAVMLTYSDVDFQRLTLNENSKRTQGQRTLADISLAVETSSNGGPIQRKKNNALPDWIH